MALFCRKRSSRETERRRRVHKLNFKFSCWITIVSHASPHYWMGNKKKASTFQGNNFKKKKKHFKSHLFFYIHALYWHKHNSLCAIFIIFFFLPLWGRKNVGWVNGSIGKGCSGLISHLVEVVMRAHVRWGRRRHPHPGGQVWKMSCVDDVWMYRNTLVSQLLL